MSKSSFPLVKPGGNVLSKLAWFVITVLLAVLAIQHPVEAGQVLTSVLTWLGGLLTAIGH